MNWIKTLLVSLVVLIITSAAQGQALTITTNQALESAVIGESITPRVLSATGGTAPYTWSLVSGLVTSVGKLATGLSVTAGGQIVGTPTALQATTGFTVRVTESSTPVKTSSKVLNIAVVSANPKLSLAAMNAATVGANYTWTFAASEGKTPYTWSSNSTLPQGLTLNSTTGLLSGMLSESQSPGSFTLAITVTGNNSKSSSGNLVLVINPSFVWVTESGLANGKVAATYSANLTVAGGKAPYGFVTKNGSSPLPGGLTLKGRLSGIPSAAGNFSFTITAKDSAGPVNTIERTFTLAIESYGMSVSGPATLSGQQYKVITPGTFGVTGGVAPYKWSTTPVLPAALTINATSGVISGNLTAVPGNYTVAVMVKDKGNQTASQNCTVTIHPVDLLEWVTESGLANGKVAATYSANLTVAGGKAPYGFVTKNGSSPLPGGLTL
ncbi:MAG: putative Ig domain-containing protein, partial [Verrucomicrobia bacterium]|nr:putative Ig domain-containing protein [Verrucomicrobiota bacterium]